MNDGQDADRHEPERPSKSQRKRDMHALQELGSALVELSAEQLARIELPDGLREAIDEARRTTGHEARRRQLQYIGRLMRELDPQPIRAALDALNGVSREHNALHHRLERLRERLLEDEAALGEIAADFPGADLQHLRHLRRNAVKERAAGKPPRSYREIFRALRELAEGSRG